MLDPKTKQRYARPYMWAVMALGLIAGVFTLTRLDTSGLARHRTEEHQPLVDKWIAATGRMPE